MLELRILNDSTKLKRKEDSDHLSKLQEQNEEEYEDAVEEVENGGKRKGNQIKNSIQRK